MKSQVVESSCSSSSSLGTQEWTPGTSWWQDLGELTKIRLSAMVLFSTLIGFLAGWPGAWAGYSSWPLGLLLATLLGTGLCATGAATLNQWWERDSDARMQRTARRPLPAGRMHAGDALLLGILQCVAGVLILLAWANGLSAALASLTVLLYLLIYTPMKKLSAHNTLVGAVAGALPPLIGWTAASGRLGPEGIFLFAVLWFWQMPHFLAIAWLYREDYARGGFVMLSLPDENGLVCARQSFFYCCYLFLLGFLPVVFGQVAWWFILVGGGLGGFYLWKAWRFFQTPEVPRARSLFLSSLLYLPLFLISYLLAKALSTPVLVTL